jgi:chorismate mutase
MARYLDEPLVLPNKSKPSVDIVATEGRTLSVDPTGGEPDLPPIPEVEGLQLHLDRLDAELLSLIRRRTAMAQQLGAARVRAGGPRFVHDHELAVVRSYQQLGPAGRDLATILVKLGR